MTDWRARAACRDANPAIFFPVGRVDGLAATAKEICSRCPVRTECLEMALACEPLNSIREGIFGGLTPGERAREALQRLSSVGPVRQHINELRAAGWMLREIAAAAGLPLSTVRHVTAGRIINTSPTVTNGILAVPTGPPPGRPVEQHHCDQCDHIAPTSQALRRHRSLTHPGTSDHAVRKEAV